MAQFHDIFCVSDDPLTTVEIADWLSEAWYGDDEPCPVPKLRVGRDLPVCSCGQAARWYSLSTPPRTRCRRTGASIGTSTPGS